MPPSPARWSCMKPSANGRAVSFFLGKGEAQVAWPGVTGVKCGLSGFFFWEKRGGRRYPGPCGYRRGGVVRRTMKVRGVTVVSSASTSSTYRGRLPHRVARDGGLVPRKAQSTFDATADDSDSPYFHRPAHYPAPPIATGPWPSPPAPHFPKKKKPLSPHLTPVTPRTFIVRRTT